MMSMKGKTRFQIVSAVSVLLVMMIGVRVFAHPMTVKGTVAAIEKSRIQVRTGEEKNGQAPEWSLVDAKTKVMRGARTVTLDQAKVVVGERVVVIADDDAKGVMTALEIRLAAQ